MEAFLLSLVEQHPEQGSEIVRLASANNDFKEVCEELYLAEIARGRWQDLPERTKEYEDMLKELKEEFWAHLSRGIR